MPLCAMAGINSTNFGTTTYTGGTINYSIDLGPGGILNPGDFFTLYDAGLTPMNLTGAIANAALFTLTTNLTDTPSPFTLGTVDSSSISNIRFTYIGSAGFSGQSLGGGQNFGTFQLADATGLYRIVTVDDRHNNTSDIGLEGAPLLPVAAVPEGGSSVVLLVLAMTALGGVQRALRNRKQVVA